MMVKACSGHQFGLCRWFSYRTIILPTPDLDKVVRLGANCGIFILGKYYAKPDDCEVYTIATSIYFVLHQYQFSLHAHLHFCSPHPYPPLLVVQEESWLARRVERSTPEEDPWTMGHQLQAKTTCTTQDIVSHVPLDSPATLSNVHMLAFVTMCHNLFPQRWDGLTGWQTWAQPLGWPLSHWVC